MSEKRKKPRKRPEKLVYVEIEPSNGGIMLNASGDGFSFQAVSPVVGPGPIRFRFNIDPRRKIEGEGELVWSDDTKKAGGLRFTNVSADSLQVFRSWLGEAAAAASGKSSLPAAALPLDTLAQQRRREKGQQLAQASVPQPEKPRVQTPPPPPAASPRVSESLPPSPPRASESSPRPLASPPVAPPPSDLKPQPLQPQAATSAVSSPRVQESPPQAATPAPASVRASEPAPRAPSAPSQSSQSPAPPQQRSAFRLDLRSVHPTAEGPPPRSVVPPSPPDLRPTPDAPQNFSAGSAMLTPRERRAKLREEALLAASALQSNPAAEASPAEPPSPRSAPPPQPPPPEPVFQPAPFVAPQANHPHPPAEARHHESAPWQESASHHEPVHHHHEEVRLIPPPAPEFVPVSEEAASGSSRFTLRWAVAAMLLIMICTALVAYRRAVGESLIWLGQKIAGPPSSSQIVPPVVPGEAPSTNTPVTDSQSLDEPSPSASQPSAQPPEDFSSAPVPVTTKPPSAPASQSAETIPSPSPAAEKQFVSAKGSGELSHGVDSQALWQEVERGNPTAEVALAHLYVTGQGVTKSCDQARILLSAAAKNGSAEAQRQLASLAKQGCPQ